MKKKIAGVLTTVLAASLLVGGNSSVTVEKDNMIAQSQDSEETQSDEAEEEDTQSEEAEEVAKVAADPEDQPAATETPKEEKKAEKETQKRELPRTAPTVLPQTKKHFSRRRRNWHSSMTTQGRFLFFRITGSLQPVIRCRRQYRNTERKEMPVWNIRWKILPMCSFIH